MENRYPRIERVELENFMAFDKAEATFDENNIINLKGYNSSGKTTFIRALWVIFFNYKPNKQVKWIKHGQTKFVITVYFADGNKLERGKLKSGKSWYTLYNDLNEELYSTIVDGQYQKVIDVPEVVKKYLGFIYDTKLNPHFLRSREKLFLVDTTGGENYQFLNIALQGDELLKATDYAKNDQGKLKNEITYLQHELNVYKDIYYEGAHLTEELVNKLQELDMECSIKEEQMNSLSGVLQKRIEEQTLLTYRIPVKSDFKEKIEEVAFLNKILELQVEKNKCTVLPIDKVLINNENLKVEVKQLNKLLEIKKLKETEASIDVIPKKLDKIKDLEKLNQLLLIQEKVSQKELLEEATLPSISIIKTEEMLRLKQLEVLNKKVEEYNQLEVLPKIKTEALVNELNTLKTSNNKLTRVLALIIEEENYDKEIKETEASKIQLMSEEAEIMQELQQQGYEVYTCQHCHSINLIGEEHEHKEVKV